MRKIRRTIPTALAACMAVSGMSVSIPARAAAPDSNAETGKSDIVAPEGYNLVWNDEFDGTELNRDDWNVELHDPGWVNSEWQKYVDSEENIKVDDGKLVITPIKKVETVKDNSAGNMLSNADFSDSTDAMKGWTETIAGPAWGKDEAGNAYTAQAERSISDGKITYSISDVGFVDWHIQLKQDGLNLENGKTYKGSFKVTSTKARTIKTGVMGAGYAWYGGSDIALEAGVERDVEFSFTMNKSDAEGYMYISLGKIADEDTPASDITISDIRLEDPSVEVSEEATKEIVSYTSGRINTQNKQTFTYGYFETRAKVPAGQGYLPAFWLMANDENVYGQWPRCGEIDCMEVMGQETDKLYGTIHFGNPHSEKQGTYKLDAETTDFSEDFHTYGCEWLPGVIKWYVDGECYYETSDWYSTTEGQGTLTYPAPFDQPFYVILNLAIGGSWVGNPNEETSFVDNDYEVDYVRVFQKDEYDENVKRPEQKFEEREPGADGNFVVNSDFSENESLTDDNDWKFLTALDGDAVAEIKDNAITVKTINQGTVDYSVQLIQANLPLEKGARYEISFDGYASENRTLNFDVKAPDRGYISYMPTQKPVLTTEKQNFKYEFKMTSASDENARVEFNLGKMGSTADVVITNVVLKKIAEPDPNEKEEKTVLANGNYIYNGNFQEGDKHLGYWDITPAEAKVSVSNFEDGRRLVTDDAVTISQSDLAFKEGIPYIFSFNAKATEATKVTATIGGNKLVFDLEADGEIHEYQGKLPSTTEMTDQNVVINISGAASIDDVSLKEAALIKNGSFDDGMKGYTSYIADDASASYVVDSLKEDNALSVTIEDTADADYKVQFKQENVKLEKGKKYRLTFDAKSNLARHIRVIMQGGESLGWPVYSSDNTVELTNEFTTFTDEFVMEADTDSAAFLSICMGAINLGTYDEPDLEKITTSHEVVVDNISLEEVHVHEFTEVVSNGDGTHSYVCECGEIDEKNANIACEGGKATCEEKAVCDVCDGEYGELAAHVGKKVSCDKKAVCDVCGKEFGNISAHKGGTATCTKKAVCEVCNKEYGELAAHKEVKNVTPATTEKEGKITYTCSVCGKELKAAEILEKLDTPSKPQKPEIKLAKTEVKATASVKGIKVTWKKNKKADGYYVLRSTNNGKTYKKVKTVNKNTTVKFIDKKANKSGQKYCYKVVAFKKDGSKIIKSASNKAVYYYLSIPTIKKLTNTKNKVVVSWKANKKATGYEIKYSTKSSLKNGKRIYVKKGTTSKKTITGLKKGVTYYVRVKAYKQVGKVKYYSARSVKKIVVSK